MTIQTPVLYVALFLLAALTERVFRWIAHEVILLKFSYIIYKLILSKTAKGNTTTCRFDCNCREENQPDSPAELSGQVPVSCVLSFLAREKSIIHSNKFATAIHYRQSFTWKSCNTLYDPEEYDEILRLQYYCQVSIIINDI